MDRNEGALQAATKALEHAVLPAVDPADPLAGEQLRLVVAYLRLLRKRLGHIEDRARFEFEHYRAMAMSLHDEARAEAGEIAQRFDSALAQAEAATRPAAMCDATTALASAVSGLVRAAGNASPERRGRIERTVATQSRRWVDAQRAWFAPVGFELRPEQLPALNDALDPVRTRSRDDDEAQPE
jgi:hypothetical protein